MIVYADDVYDDARQFVACQNDYLGFYKFLEGYFGDDEGGISIQLDLLRKMSDKAKAKYLEDYDNFSRVMDTVDIYDSDMWLSYLLEVHPEQPGHEWEVIVKEDDRIIVRDFHIMFVDSERDKAVQLVARLTKQFKISTEDITEALL